MAFRLHFPPLLSPSTFPLSRNCVTSSIHPSLTFSPPHMLPISPVPFHPFVSPPPLLCQPLLLSLSVNHLVPCPSCLYNEPKGASIPWRIIERDYYNWSTGMFHVKILQPALLKKVSHIKCIWLMNWDYAFFHRFLFYCLNPKQRIWGLEKGDI